MKYIVYITENLKSKINGLNKIYIGVHKTEDPSIFDGYIGCGVWIHQPSTFKYPKTPFQYAVKKYGVSAFKRTILFIYDTAKEAYDKESELVSREFLLQAHVYNVKSGGEEGREYSPLYQFDLQGNLVKTWEYSIEAVEFYGYPMSRFNYAVDRKLELLNSYWSRVKEITLNEYNIARSFQNPVYLYSKEGKLLQEFSSRVECAKYLNIKDLYKTIKYQQLVDKQYYVSESLVDEFRPKARANYKDQRFYVYNNEQTLVGIFVGKEIMSIINLHSWQKIRDILNYNHGWYKDFYISLEEVNGKFPPKKWSNGYVVSVYTKYGEFIETINTLKELKQKYNIPANKIKNIQLGDRHFGEYIFKYNKSSK